MGHIQSFSASTPVSSKDFSVRNTRLRRITSGPAFVQIAVDPEEEAVSELLDQNNGVPMEPILRAPKPELQIITVDKENTIPDKHVGNDESVTMEKSKRRAKKRRSIGQQSGRRKKRPSDESVQSMAEEALQDNAPRPIEEEPEWETMIGEESSLLPEKTSKPSAQDNSVGKKRRKRKSVVVKPRKRKRSGEFGTQGVVSPAELPSDDEAHIQDTIEQAVPAEPTPKVHPNRATRRRISDTSNIHTPGNGPAYEPEIVGDETYVDEGVSPEKPTPKVPSKKAKTKARKSRRSGSDAQNNSSQQGDPSSRVKKSSKATFPILTRRMTNISALSTINEDAEDYTDAAADLESLKNKFTDRSAPNAIDVLAQICRETLSTTISKLSTGSSAVSSRDLKRKRTAIEAFGAEIESRLFDMSVAIEYRLTLEARVKKAKKAKTEAQNEWLEIRQQREEIALKSDDVRARNLRIEAEGRETYELSERLHELEMVVEKPELDGDSGASDGLDYMLRSVAKSVSCAAGGGGVLLDRVKAFNRHLERTALVLEGRELD